MIDLEIKKPSFVKITSGKTPSMFWVRIDITEKNKTKSYSFEIWKEDFNIKEKTLRQFRI